VSGRVPVAAVGGTEDQGSANLIAGRTWTVVTAPLYVPGSQSHRHDLWRRHGAPNVGPNGWRSLTLIAGLQMPLSITEAEGAKLRFQAEACTASCSSCRLGVGPDTYSLDHQRFEDCGDLAGGCPLSPCGSCFRPVHFL